MTDLERQPTPDLQKGAGMRMPRLRYQAVGFMLSPGDPAYQDELARIQARRRELEAQRQERREPA